MSRLQALIISIGFVIYMLLPFAGGLAGYGPEVIENRPLRPAPPLTLAALGKDYFPQLEIYLRDHMPLRAELVSLNSLMMRTLWGESSSPRVQIGKEGWLFYTVDFPPRGCSTPAEARRILNGVKALGDILTAEGKHFFLYPIPNKSSMYPELLPGRLSNAVRCNQERRAMTWENPGPASDYLFNIGAILRTAQEDSPEPIYRTRDTHWTTYGATLAVRDIINRIQPGIWSDESLVPREREAIPGGLSYMLGRGELEEEARYNVVRPGVETTMQLLEGGRVMDFHSVSQGPPLIPGKTIIVYDSFIDIVIDLFPPYFENIRFVHEANRARPATIKLIAESDNIVFGLVERTLFGVLWYTAADYHRQILGSIRARQEAAAGAPAPVPAQ